MPWWRVLPLLTKPTCLEDMIKTRVPLHDRRRGGRRVLSLYGNRQKILFL